MENIEIYKEILIDDLIIFAAIIIVYLYPKKKINSIVGYKTTKSMKNEKNWLFAQSFFFKRLLIVIPLIINLQVVLYYFNIKNVDVFSFLVVLIYIAILSVITERKLQQN